MQRSLGVSRGRIFFLFLGESAIPALVGVGISLIGCGLALGLPLTSLLLPGLGFFCAFLLGSAAAVLLLLGGDVLAVLAAAD